MREKVSVLDVAKELRQQKPYIYVLVKRLGITPIMEVTPDSKGHKIMLICRNDVARIDAYLKENGLEENENALATGNTPGVFYLIQLEPTHDPGRIKLGFATNADDRLRSHRTAAPFSRIVKTWPSKLLWEKTAIDCVTQNCERLRTEVFRASDVVDVERRCDRFFSMMPRFDSESSEPE
jgi:hypothetical protein